MIIKIFKDTHSIPQHPIKGIMSGRNRKRATAHNFNVFLRQLPSWHSNIPVAHPRHSFNGAKMKFGMDFPAEGSTDCLLV